MAQTTRLASFGPILVIATLRTLLIMSKHRLNLKIISLYKKKKFIEKKTYQGPKRRIWRRLGQFSSSRTLLVMSKGPCWPSLAIVGCCGPSWACVGPPWAAVGLHWPSVGCCGPALAVVGCCGPSWACVGLPWAAVGLCWPSLAVVGCCGPALAVVGRRWVLWACVGRRWVLWAFVGLRWPSVGCCGPVLAFVGRRWVLWAFVVNKTEKKKIRKHT